MEKSMLVILRLYDLSCLQSKFTRDLTYIISFEMLLDCGIGGEVVVPVFRWTQKK